MSLATFISSSIMCAYLWHRNITNDKPFALFIMCFSLMQLFEFFMWIDMKGHTVPAKLSLIFLQLQPLTLVAGLYYLRPTIYKELWEKLVLLGVGLISLLKALSAAFYAFVTDAKGKWLSVKGPHCHLIWWFNKHSNRLPRLALTDHLYGLMLLCAILMIKPFKNALFYSFLTISTYFITKKYYPGENGSLWCWVANFVALSAIAM